jgi:hypothetical protein
MQTARDYWAQRVRDWKASGLTAAAYAEKWGINARTLAHWSWRLGKEAGGGLTAEPARFLEVTPPTATWWRAAERIEVVIDDRLVVRVPDAFDPATLRRVVAALTSEEGEE